jgi:hypothetical protein
VREIGERLVTVEAKSPARPAETDRAELAGMGVDPISINAQLVGEGRGINVATGPAWLIRAKQVRYAVRDLLNVVGIQLHLLADATEARESHFGLSVGS